MSWAINLSTLVVLTLIVRLWAQLGQRRVLFRRLLLGTIGVLGLGACLISVAILWLSTTHFTRAYRDLAEAVGAAGLGLLLPLLSPVRRALSRITPIDPSSLLDTVGLCSAFAFIGLSIGITQTLPTKNFAAQPVTVTELVAQAVTFILVALVLAGFVIERDWQGTIQRLGVRRLSLYSSAIAVALIGALFVTSGLAGALTQILQPDLTDQVSQRMVELTGQVSSIRGAIVLGVSAGVGEELLFRGAIQPRLGVWLTSVVFTMAHVQYQFSFLLVGVFLLSVVLGWERQRYGTLACIVTHAGYDLVAVLLQSVVR